MIKLKKPKEKFIVTLKCPFCKKPGYTAITSVNYRNYYSTQCINSRCDVRPCTGFKNTSNESIKVWNKRGTK